MRKIIGIASAASLALVAFGCSQTPALPPPPTEVLAVPGAAIPDNPQDPAWTAIPEFIAPLFPQSIVEPRLLTASTSDVRVKAMTAGKEMAFRVEWNDATQDDVPQPARFSDACAVQVPAAADADAPPPQMGEPGKPVQITYWRAYWQAAVEGRAASLKDLYPNAAPDHYPAEAPVLQEDPAAHAEAVARYAPSRAVGNMIAAPPNAPVQDLIAEGPGGVSPAPTAESRGRGQRTANGWAVVLIRPIPEGVAATTRSQVAFAVWEGAKNEVGSRKMITKWLPLTLQRNQPS